MRAVEAVLREYVDNAAHLWTQLDDARSADPYDAEWVADLEPRLKAHLHGLTLAGEGAWPFALEAVETIADKGAHFAAAHLSLTSGAPRLLQHVADCAETTEDGDFGVIGALAMVPPARSSATLREWLAAPHGHRRYLATAAFRVMGVDLRGRLPRVLDDPDPRVRREACRVAGLCRRDDVQARVKALLDDIDPAVRDRAAQAMAALGHGSAATTALKAAALRQQNTPPGALSRTDALKALADVLPEDAFRDWLRALSQDNSTLPISVRGLGPLGDTTHKTWLVRQMDKPDLCLPAAQAFLELHGPVDDLEDMFFPDALEAADALGPAFADLKGPIPIAGAFDALLENPVG